MNSIKKSLENWLNQLNHFSFTSYESLPDIDLYMDQIINYLDKQLYVFQTTSTDKQITPSMINNYVKGNVIPSPISKRYNKEHIAQIDEVCTLKQVLTLAEVKQIEDNRYLDKTIKSDIFNSFNKLNSSKINSAVTDAFKSLNNIDENDTEALINLALDFSLTANAYISIAKRILFLARSYELINKNRENK